ncbi:immunoglobulin-like domain-containing protein, partial [Paenibacillus sp. N3.4]|uniref:immunoglobulin-like domain-containing protein n=1 Tax=Paenibacillus sp. N3.4 TaxID=2603222 RepID=UPI0028FCE203
VKTSNDEVVTLTATITKGTSKETKEFTVNVVKQTTFNEAESVAADKATLDIGYSGNDKAVSVTQDLRLLSTGANGTSIAWTSNSLTIDAATGKVIRPVKTSNDEVVTLTATITKGTSKETKEFTVNVVKQTTFNEVESVAADKAALNLVYDGTDTAVGVTKSVILPEEGTNGTTITWTSSNLLVIAANGVVNRPTNIDGDAAVTLTATITKNGVTDQKTFNLTVLKNSRTSAPLSSDIVVTNNVAGQNDVIKVSSLQAGDLVNVYSSTGDLLGSAKVASGVTFATVEVTQLSTAAGSVQITVTRGDMDESIKVNAPYAAENAKPYVISGTALDTTSGIKASVTITPTEGLTYSGSKLVVFELMNGDTAVSINAFDFDATSNRPLIAHFNTVYNANHKVKVMILDQYNVGTDNVGTPLANQVVLSK